jgi:lipopolysaccharide cholinephosphotransferase
LSICESDFSNKFIFVSYKNTKNSHCYFPRIILKEEYRKKYDFPKNNERGLVLIDVLPLDGMKEKKIRLKLHIIKAKILRLLASIWTYGVKDNVSMHSSKKDKIIGFLYKIKVHRLYKQDTIYKKMDKLYSKYEFGKTINAGMIASSKMEKEIMNFSIWSSGTKIKFGKSKYLVPLKYDEYLKKLFGNDYLIKEPTEREKQKSHLYGGL